MRDCSRKILFAVLILLAGFGPLGCSKDAKRDRHVRRADDYFKQGEYQRAEIEYKNALRFGMDARILHQLGLIYEEQGRGPLARSAFAEAMRTAPDDAVLRFKLAGLEAQAGNISNTQAEVSYVLSKQPTNTEALLILASTARKRDDIPKVRQSIQEMAAKLPPSADFHLAMATLDLRESNLPAAEQHLQKASQLSPNTPSLDSGWAALRLAQTNFVEAEVLLKRAADNSPLRSARRMNWIDFKLRTGDVPAAKKALEEMMEKAPDFLPALFRTAEIAFTEKNYAEAEKLSARANTLAPEAPEVGMLRANIAFAQNKAEEGLRELMRLEGRFPNNPDLKFQIARAHLLNGDAAKADSYLDQALKLQPDFAPAVLLSAELDIRSGKAANAITALNTFLKAHPENSQAPFILANAYRAENRPDDALRIYRQVATLYPSNAQPWLLIGSALRQKNDLPGARAAFERSLQMAPHYVAPLAQLIELDLVIKDYPAALQRTQKLKELSTNSPAGLLTEARIYAIQKDVPKAEALLKEGLQRFPDEPSIYSALSSVYRENQQMDKALEQLNALTASNPKLHVAWVEKGTVHEFLQQRDQAVEAYLKAIEANPRSYAALNNLAMIVAEDPKRLDEALNYATKAREAAPASPLVADTLGWVYAKRGEFMRARPLLQEALEKIPVAEVRYHVGIMEAALDNVAVARQQFQQAIAGDLKPELQSDAQGRLKTLDINPSAATAADVAHLQQAISKDRDYQAHLKLGAIYELRGESGDASNQYQAASRLNPQSAAPLLGLARIHAEKDPARALQFAREARRIAPTDPSVAVAMGTLAVRNGDFSSGYAVLQEASRSGALNPEALYSYGTAQFAVGRVSESTTTLNSVKAQANAAMKQLADESLLLANPQSPAVQRQSAAESRLKQNANDPFGLFAQAQLADAAKNSAEAISSYEKLVAAAPSFAPARKRLALLYSEVGKDDRGAQTHAAKARELMPNDPEIATVLGKLALKRGEHQNALFLFEETARLQPTNGESFYLVGMANLGLKRTNEAKVALNKALTLSLPPERSSEVKRLVENLK